MITTNQLREGVSSIFNGFHQLRGPGGSIVIYTRDGQIPQGLVDSSGNYKYFGITADRAVSPA